MSEFNPGDKVRLQDDERLWTVTGPSVLRPGFYAIEAEVGDDLIGGVVNAEFLHRVPEPATPWQRFTPYGTFTGRHRSLADAVEHSIEGHFILHITTGKWYDHQGEAIA